MHVGPSSVWIKELWLVCGCTGVGGAYNAIDG